MYRRFWDGVKSFKARVKDMEENREEIRFFVIPAKAGIRILSRNQKRLKKLDSGFRRNDGSNFRAGKNQSWIVIIKKYQEITGLNELV